MEKHERAFGKRRWAIAEGYIPASSHGESRELTSHEAVCVLNTGLQAANVTLTLYFTNRDPVGPYKFTVAAQRSLHIRMNDLKEPEVVPLATEYSSVIESDVPIVVQHTRLDSRQAANALMTTIAYSET